MTDFLGTLLPMIAFMLIPVWIPVVAVAIGALRDLVAPRKPALVKVEVDRKKLATASLTPRHMAA
jgi:hypothetical protein